MIFANGYEGYNELVLGSENFSQNYTAYSIRVTACTLLNLCIGLLLFLKSDYPDSKQQPGEQHNIVLPEDRADG
jgi:hypothetical protein